MTPEQARLLWEAMPRERREQIIQSARDLCAWWEAHGEPAVQKVAAEMTTDAEWYANERGQE